MRDFRIWWGLFVTFAVLSLLAVQRGYRRWRIAREALDRIALPGAERHRRRLRREGWRLAWMAVGLITMTALVFAALLGAPAPAILGLRVTAVVAVAAVVGLSLLR
jgi:fatty acid desaturase